MGSWTEDKKGKFIGAIFMMVMYLTPMIGIQYLQEKAGRMGGQKAIKAVLKHDINYNDLSGNTKVIKGGEVIDLYIVKEGHTITDASGHTSIQRKPAFIAIKGFDSFDVGSDEFKTVD